MREKNSKMDMYKHTFDPNVDITYDDDINSYIITIDGHEYEWREHLASDGPEIQIYKDKWVKYGDLMQTVMRFASIHHDKKFYKRYFIGDIEVTLDGDISILKKNNLRIEIIFDKVDLEEKIMVEINKNGNIYSHSYKRSNNYYTYNILVSVEETLINVLTDILGDESG